MQVSTMVLAAALTMFGTQNMSGAAGGRTVDVDEVCQVALIYESDIPADLPAQQGGRLLSVAVKEGDRVAVGQVLATVDNELEKKSEEVSRYRLEMANEEAENDVNVRYAQKAADVHEYRLRQVLEADHKVPQAYTESEVKTYRLQWEQFLLQKEQAEHEQKLAFMSVSVRRAEHELAQHELHRREIKAPVAGVIEDVTFVVGDWVRAGDPIAKLVQYDRLEINTFLKYGNIGPADVRGKDVTVTVELVGGRKESFYGRVDHASGTLHGGRFKIRVEVDNKERVKDSGDWMLMPGMNAKMQIHL